MSNQIASFPLWGQVYMYTLLVVGAAGCWLFIALYWRAHKWWANDFGRHLVAMSACLGSFLTFAGVVAIWPELPGRDVIRLVLFHALVATIVQRLWVFGRYEHARAREESARRQVD